MRREPRSRTLAEGDYTRAVPCVLANAGDITVTDTELRVLIVDEQPSGTSKWKCTLPVILDGANGARRPRRAGDRQP